MLYILCLLTHSPPQIFPHAQLASNVSCVIGVTRIEMFNQHISKPVSCAHEDAFLNIC